jgi:F-type H+-transporting ATPase subunit a
MILLSATTAAKNSTAEGQEENIGEYIIHHVQNTNEWNIFGYHLHLPHFEPFTIFGITVDMSITNHVVMIWLAAITLILLFKLSFRRNKLIPTGFGSILEMLVLFIRDEVAIANLGEKDGKKFTPLIGTFFFFILICNLMGLIPLFSTPTSNINLTAALAIVTFATGQIFGIKNNGIFGHIKALVPSGVPFFLRPIMFVIELMGLLAKHFALIVRLFANMIAGHIVFFAFLGLIMIFKSIWISPLSVGFAVFVDLLEILVSFIQAYVFTILSTLFIGMAIHPEH